MMELSYVQCGLNLLTIERAKKNLDVIDGAIDHALADVDRFKLNEDLPLHH